MDLYDSKGGVFPLGGASWPVTGHTTVCHRGYYSPSEVVENTLPAFYLARKKGFDGVECDIRISSDGIPVLMHDATFTDIDGNAHTVAEETAAELTDAVMQRSAEYGVITVPTLYDCLSKCRLLGLVVIIDIKQNLTAEQATTVARVVLEAGMQGRVEYVPKSAATAQVILQTDHNASFQILMSTIAADLSTYSALLTGGNHVGISLQANVADSVGGADTLDISSIRAAGLDVDWWNIRDGYYVTYMDTNPRYVTLQSGQESKNLDKRYIEAQKLY